MPPVPPTDDDQANLDLLVDTARDRLGRGLDDADALDAKALGFLALSGAGIALLVATHESLNRFWWIPTAGFAAAAGLLICASWPRGFDEGPALEWLYDRWVGTGVVAEDASRAMLSELLKSLTYNGRIFGQKAFYLYLGMIALVLSSVGSLPIALIRPAAVDPPCGYDSRHGNGEACRHERP
jgi:hypothetical protein